MQGMHLCAIKVTGGRVARLRYLFYCAEQVISSVIKHKKTGKPRFLSNGHLEA